MLNSFCRNFTAILSAFAITLTGINASAANYQFTWMRGSKAINAPGSRIMQNEASPENSPQALSRCGLWKDEAGHVWLYGGIGQITGAPPIENNELWKFDTASGNWAWIWGHDESHTSNYDLLGGESEFNRPGARVHSQMWTDTSGTLWLFGGRYGTISHRDFWKFNFASGRWTWVAGDGRSAIPGYYGTKGVPAAENYPNGRDGAATWKDSENQLWMFGGLGPIGHRLNDIWKFDPRTGYWTWIGGGNTSNTTSTYVEKGVAAPENDPGGRTGSIGWTDPVGNLWIYGGQLLNGEYSDDVWKYDVSLRQWAFMDGTTTASTQPIYGTLQIPHEDNTPGSRAFASGASDSSGNLLLFGGGIQYRQPSGSFGYNRKNDLWKYDIAAGNWTWIGGSQGINEFGVYGTAGISDASNRPGGRVSSTVFTDQDDNLWIFGGLGGAESTVGYLNDLWKVTAVPEASIVGWEMY